MNLTIKPIKNFERKEITVPGDKSISHRSIMLGAISKGITEITGFLMGDDCLATIDCFRAMGIEIEISKNKVIVHGKGLNGLKQPSRVLDVGNSGTTIRLLSGLLSGQKFTSVITGDDSIKKRPMLRVIKPLREMGAVIESENDSNLAPLKISEGNIKGFKYTLPVASAQVKSAIILAALYANDVVQIVEPMPSRDHTELMINYLGGNITKENNVITVNPIKELIAKNIEVPGDISSAAYFMVLGLITENCELKIKNIGINKTRDGIITVLKNMGGNIEIVNERVVSGEKVCDIIVKTSKLKGTIIGGDIIPTLIDEIPIIAVCALFAEGETIIKNAEELKVKESNRILAMVTELSKTGANVLETDDGMILKGGNKLSGAEFESYGDHRIAMSLAILATRLENESVIKQAECASVSFPNFYDYIM